MANEVNVYINKSALLFNQESQVNKVMDIFYIILGDYWENVGSKM